MPWEKIIAFAVVLIQLAGVSVYVRAMMHGRARPNRVTWSIWALAPLIGVWLAFKAGGGLELLPVFMAGFNPVIVLIASFIIKEGYWEIKKFDIYCGTLALMALVMWFITENFSISILFAIISDGLAAVPTIVKSWRFPESENAGAYVGGMTANALGLFMVKEWSFPIYSMGVYLVLLNLLLVFNIYRNKLWRKIHPQPF